MTSITKYTSGDLLSIEAKETEFPLLKLSDTKLKKILITRDNSVIGVNFYNKGVVEIKNLSFEDEDLGTNILDLSKKH